jgi:hypothetical protein
MSAVHLVAYGVLKLENSVGQQIRNAEIYELVKKQLKQHDILLHVPTTRNDKLRRRPKTLQTPYRYPNWSVYGPLCKVGAFKIREPLGNGGFIECCALVAQWLDKHNKLEK